MMDMDALRTRLAWMWFHIYGVRVSFDYYFDFGLVTESVRDFAAACRRLEQGKETTKG